MKYSTILFDLDGTLLNTLSDLTDSINHTLINYNLPTHTEEEIKSYVGNGLKKLVERSLPDYKNFKEFDSFFSEFVEYYNSHNQIKTGPYNNVIETIKELNKRGIKMAIVTNKAQTASESLLKDFFYPEIEVVVGDGGGRKTKPAPDNVNEALHQLNITDKKDVLYVGDSEVDAMTAINSDLDYLLCTWGFRSVEQLKEFNPIDYISDMKEILNYV